MSKVKAKKKKKFQTIVMTAPDSRTRIIVRKNNPSINKDKLSFKKYCPILRKRLLFTETSKERHLK